MEHADELKQLSPYVRVAANSLETVPWFVRERVIWDFEILFVKEGHVLVTVEDKEYEGAPGDIFVFKPRQRHSIKDSGTCGHVLQPHIHFDLIERPDSPELNVSFKMPHMMSDKELNWFRTDLLSSGPLTLPNHIRLRHPERFESLLYELIDEFQRKLPLYEISCKGHLLSLIIYLIRHGNRSQELPGPDALAIREHLYQHADREVTLEELAGLFKISKYYLVRLYKKHFQSSPIQHHKQLRFDKAKQLLRFSNLSVQQIADQLGFGSIHAFSRAFKAAEGISPLQYRSSPVVSHS